jgi:hypothetical protein
MGIAGPQSSNSSESMSQFLRTRAEDVPNDTTMPDVIGNSGGDPTRHAPRSILVVSCEDVIEKLVTS